MSDHKKILNKNEWSFSTLNLYETCPYAFYLKKIERPEERPINNAYAEIGSYVHELHEEIFKGKMAVQEALDDCVYHFDDHVIEYITEKSREEKYIALCGYLACFDEDYSDKYEVLGVEKEIHWKIGKHKCICYIDLILRRKSDGKVFLIDHKSSGHFLKANGDPLKNQAVSFESYTKQMYLYADAMYKEMGFYPDFIVWNHFLDSTKMIDKIPFDEDGLNKTLIWFNETVEKIYNDTEFEAVDSYMMCNKLCNYRNGICPYREIFNENREG